MKTISKTITLTDKQDDWIKAQIDAGNYTDDSDYIRDLIRREQERSAETEAYSHRIDRRREQRRASAFRCFRIQGKNADCAWLNTCFPRSPT